MLIPEVPFVLEGEHGLLAYLQRIMEEKGGCTERCYSSVQVDVCACAQE